METVELTDGTELAADLVVVGIGVQPDVDLAAEAGLAVDDGVVVDASLRTRDPDIFAAGDVACAEHPMLGRAVRVEHWANALPRRHRRGQGHARPATSSTTGSRTSTPTSTRTRSGMEYAGWVEPGEYDQVVFRGDPTVRPGASPSSSRSGSRTTGYSPA